MSPVKIAASPVGSLSVKKATRKKKRKSKILISPAPTSRIEILFDTPCLWFRGTVDETKTKILYDDGSEAKYNSIEWNNSHIWRYAKCVKKWRKGLIH